MGGSVSTLVGKEKDVSKFTSIAAGKKDGMSFVIDTQLNQIIPSGEVSKVAGLTSQGLADGPMGVAKFNCPQGIASPELHGSVYVADESNNRIRKISADWCLQVWSRFQVVKCYQKDDLTEMYDEVWDEYATQVVSFSILSYRPK